MSKIKFPSVESAFAFTRMRFPTLLKGITQEEESSFRKKSNAFGFCISGVTFPGWKKTLGCAVKLKKRHAITTTSVLLAKLKLDGSLIVVKNFKTLIVRWKLHYNHYVFHQIIMSGDMPLLQLIWSKKTGKALGTTLIPFIHTSDTPENTQTHPCFAVITTGQSSFIKTSLQ